MLSLTEYPYASYVPNKIVAACVGTLVGFSLIAWTIQSYQNRFRPLRLIFLLTVSHLTIFIELILRAGIDVQTQDSKYVFILINTLFITGQRMIIVGNFVFLMTIHREKPRPSKIILLCTVLCVISSGVLMSPATMLSFDPDHIQTSYFFRILSSSILLCVTLAFYPVWYWTKTLNYMSQSAKTLMLVSSVACVIVALFTLIQSFPHSYERINSNESWFYGLQIGPIIIAHCTWSSLHPKRTLLLPSSPCLFTTNVD